MRILNCLRRLSGLALSFSSLFNSSLVAQSTRWLDLPSVGNWIFGCDICQEVCPWNRHAPGTAESALRSRLENGTLPLAELLSLDESAFRERFRGSPIIRAKRRGLLRSAAIALGNHPAPEIASPDDLEALTQALTDHEPIVRGAAAWALGQWRQRSGQLAETIVRTLETHLVSEEDPAVQAEITAALD